MTSSRELIYLRRFFFVVALLIFGTAVGMAETDDWPGAVAATMFTIACLGMARAVKIWRSYNADRRPWFR